MKYNLYITIFLACFTYIGSINGQVVYPGDANQDSIVNNIDVLYLGKAYGQTGAARNFITINWGAYDVPNPLWTNDIYGIPAHFSDCDGNGTVEDNDLEAVQVNYGLEYGLYIPVGEGEGPILRVEADQDIIGLGDEMLFRILMGSDEEIFEDVEGIAYSIRMGPMFSDFEILLNFSDDNNWFIANDEAFHLLEINPLVAMDVANSRIDQSSRTGFGEVGRLSYNIDKDLIGGMIDDYTPFVVEVENIIVSYSDRIDTIQGSRDTIFVTTVNNNTTSINSDLNSNHNIDIFPNPFSSHLDMKFEEGAIGEVKIIDAFGRLKYHRTNHDHANHLSIPTMEWSQGVYILHYKSKGKTFSEIFLKQ